MLVGIFTGLLPAIVRLNFFKKYLLALSSGGGEELGAAIKYIFFFAASISYIPCGFTIVVFCFFHTKRSLLLYLLLLIWSEIIKAIKVETFVDSLLLLRKSMSLSTTTVREIRMLPHLKYVGPEDDYSIGSHTNQMLEGIWKKTSSILTPLKA